MESLNSLVNAYLPKINAGKSTPSTTKKGLCSLAVKTVSVVLQTGTPLFSNSEQSPASTRQTSPIPQVTPRLPNSANSVEQAFDILKEFARNYRDIAIRLNLDASARTDANHLAGTNEDKLRYILTFYKELNHGIITMSDIYIIKQILSICKNKHISIAKQTQKQYTQLQQQSAEPTFSANGVMETELSETPETMLVDSVPTIAGKKRKLAEREDETDYESTKVICIDEDYIPETKIIDSVKCVMCSKEFARDDKPKIRLECGHQFHKHCLETCATQILKRKCRKCTLIEELSTITSLKGRTKLKKRILPSIHSHKACTECFICKKNSSYMTNFIECQTRESEAKI